MLRSYERLLSDTRSGWWLPGKPTALVVNELGEAIGVLTFSVPSGVYAWRLACAPAISGRFVTEVEPVPTFPLIELRRRGPEVFEAQPIDGGRLEDARGFWGVVGRLPAPEFLVALQKQQGRIALRRVLTRLEEEFKLRDQPPN